MEFLTHVTALSGLAVVAIQQILKLKVVPVSFANRYPVPTLILLSILTSIFIVWRELVAAPASWTDWVLLVVTVGIVAAFTYNNTVRNWTEVRASEG